MGEAARRHFSDYEETGEQDAPARRAVPADWFVDPADQARDGSEPRVTTLDDLATAFLAAHPEAASDVLLRADGRNGSGTPENSAPAQRPAAPPEPEAADVADAHTVDASAWQAVAGLYSVSDGDAEGELAWQTDALCAQTDPEAFFPEKGGSTRDAKRVCAACPVRDECLEYAMAHDEKFGIWGGLSERERRRLRRAGR